MGSGGGVVAVIVCMGGPSGSGVLSSTGDVLEMSVLRGADGVYDMCMCLARGGVGGEDCVWALPILWEQGECWTCVCASEVHPVFNPVAPWISAS